MNDDAVDQLIRAAEWRGFHQGRAEGRREGAAQLRQGGDKHALWHLEAGAEWDERQAEETDPRFIAIWADLLRRWIVRLTPGPQAVPVVDDRTGEHDRHEISEAAE